MINAFVQEINLLGTRTIATLGYESDPDRSTVLVGFDTPRLIDNRVGIGASYSRRSDGHSAGAALSLSVLQPVGATGWRRSAGACSTAACSTTKGARAFVKDSAHRSFAIVRGDGAIALAASSHGFVRLGLSGQVKRDDFGEQGGTGGDFANDHGRCRSVRRRCARRTTSRCATTRRWAGWRMSTSALRCAPMCHLRRVRGDTTAMASVEELAASAGLRLPAGFAQVGASVSGIRSSAGQGLVHGRRVVSHGRAA